MMICRFATCCPLQSPRSPFELPASRGHRARGSLTMTVRGAFEIGFCLPIASARKFSGTGHAQPVKLRAGRTCFLLQTSIKNCTSPTFSFPLVLHRCTLFCKLGKFCFFCHSFTAVFHLALSFGFCTIRPPPKILMAESNGDAKTLKGRATTALRVPGLSIGFG